LCILMVRYTDTFPQTRLDGVQRPHHMVQNKLVHHDPFGRDE